MDLSTIGSIGQYTKTAALKAQWNLKKKSGSVTGHSKGLNDFLTVGGPAPRTQEDADNEKLQKITSKVSAGAKLTEKEMEYLRAKNPQLYEKLRQIEKEQKAYEEALHRCKSKDEAQRLHMARVGEAVQAAKDGDGTAAYRMNRMTESMTAFSETEEYRKLSTEGEQAAERQEQREAEQAGPEPQPSGAGKAGGPAAERDSKAEKTDAPAEGASAKAEKPAEPDAPGPAAARPAAAPHFGAKAYVSQQDAEAQEKTQRKAIDVDA